jgi:acetyl-CoA C-acetyltransferase
MGLEDVVNVEGSVIAHGHPIGRREPSVPRLSGMKRDAIRRGVVTLCIGGGQGIALALEAL